MTFECSQCEKKYSRKDHLRRHEQKEHSPVPKSADVECSICGAQWQYRYELNRHLKQVHGKRYRCNAGYAACNEVFSRLSQLWHHVCVNHKDIKSKAIVRSIMSGLIDDVKQLNDDTSSPVPPNTIETPSGVPPHAAICPFEDCDQFFISRERWLKHLKRHALLPFECKFCAERFAYHSELVEHYKDASNGCVREPVVRNTKPAPAVSLHECNECGKTYSTKANLKHHVETIHIRKERYVCSLCGYKTNHLSTFNRHTEMERKRREGVDPRAPLVQQWTSVAILRETSSDEEPLEHFALDEAEISQAPKRSRLIEEDCPTTELPSESP